MKRFRLFFIAACLCALAAPALADKAPAVISYGSAAAACHLSTHTESYTHGWDGLFITDESGAKTPTFQDDCGDWGHLHCYGTRVTMWDTPMKGPNHAHYKANTKVTYLGKDSQFQLAKVEAYGNQFYAMVRMLVDGVVVYTGWVNADYIGCDCPDNRTMEDIPIYGTGDYFSAPVQ